MGASLSGLPVLPSVRIRLAATMAHAIGGQRAPRNDDWMYAGRRRPSKRRVPNLELAVAKTQEGTASVSEKPTPCLFVVVPFDSLYSRTPMSSAVIPIPVNSGSSSVWMSAVFAPGSLARS